MTANRFGAATFLLAGWTLAGCAARLPDLVSLRAVPGEIAAPKIHRVLDVGTGPVDGLGPLVGQSDGVASPGELLLVEGEQFGREPSVTIAGRPAAIVGRTQGGGLLARVPPGVPTGKAPITVVQRYGRATATALFRRLALIVGQDRLDALELGAGELRRIGEPLRLPGGRLIRFCADGGIAYVVANSGGRDRLAVIDAGHAGGPRLLSEQPLLHTVVALASASEAPLLVALGAGRLTFFSCRLPHTPVLLGTVELPKDARGAHAVDVSPDGKTVALLVADGNRLFTFEVERPLGLQFVAAVDLLPDQRSPLVREVAFGSDGETLWVVSGDSAQSLPTIQPTRLTAVRMISGAAVEGSALSERRRLLSVWRTQSIPGATAPLHLAVARTAPIAIGFTLRTSPPSSGIFITTVSDALFHLAELPLETVAGAKAALQLWHPVPGMMVRAALDGGSGPLFATSQILSEIDVTADGQTVLMAAARVSMSGDRLSIERGVVFGATVSGGQPQFFSLGAVAPTFIRPPFRFGDVRIQP